MAKTRERVVYAEKYGVTGKPMQSDAFPVFPHLDKSMTVVRAMVRESGKVEVDGQVLEYHDLRVYVAEKRKQKGA